MGCICEFGRDGWEFTLWRRERGVQAQLERHCSWEKCTQPGREEIAVGRSSADEDVGWLNVPLVFNSQPRGA